MLYPRGIEDIPIDKQQLEKYKEEKYNKFQNSFNEFSICIDKYAPFYQADYYNDLNLIRQDCFSIGNIFKMYEFDTKYNESFKGCRNLSMSIEERKKVTETEKKILNAKDELLIKIRNYLNNLKLK